MLKLLCYSICTMFLSAPSLMAQQHHLRVGQLPPEISFVSFSNDKFKTINENDLNETVYLLDFWATWCAPCIASIPHMDSLMAAFRGRNVKFISITYEPKSLVEKFLRKHPMKSEIGLDEDFDMFQRYNAWAIPNIVMINSNGTIAGRIHPSKLNESIIEDLIEGKVPQVKNTPEDLFDPKKAEEYFRSSMNIKK
ncbi:MAG: TlpA disulfide reductase family protein [Bacteroidota bacterium]